MRAKHILNRLPIGTKIRLVYDRVTLTPLTTAFTVLALAHCIVQISLQAVAYASNTSMNYELSQLLHETNATGVHAFVENDQLEICQDSADGNDELCFTITSVGVAGQDDTIRPGSPSNHTSRALQMDIYPRAVNDSNLSTQCLEALNWPLMILQDARREDICFLIFQVWLFGISIVTVLNESIPHLVSALVTHVLSTIWSIFQISRTHQYGGLYKSLVVNDACGGINVLSGFWMKRLSLFIPIFALNAAASIITLFVSYKLFHVYAHQTFKRVGWLDSMNRLYSLILTFSVALQLSAFFVICSSALMVDALFNSVFVRYVVNKTAYRIVFIHICVWTLPWVFIGWSSFRREHRLWTVMFFIMGTAMVGAWVSIFPTTFFAKKFAVFPFFATITITSFCTLVVTLLLGAICRLNFGKGLPQYLENQELIDEPGFVPVFLTRKRQSKLLSIVFPDKRIPSTMRYYQSKQSGLKQGADVQNSDDAPAYDIESLGIKSPMDPKLAMDHELPRQKRGRTSFLSSLTGSRITSSSSRLSVFQTPNSDAKHVTFPESVHDAKRSSYIQSFSNPVWRTSALENSTPDTKSISTHNIHSHSTGLLSSSSSPMSPSPNTYSRITDVQSPQRSSSSTYHNVIRMTPPAGKVGLPTSPKYFK